MKKRILLVLGMCTIIILSTFITVSAISQDVEVPPLVDVSNDYDELQPAMASVCNQYGSTNWSSLQAAKNYYGNDFDYVYCGGGLYNYYYVFADGSRMYFGVH